jgi:hypothetical protein
VKAFGATEVSLEDERPARPNGCCFYCDQKIGADHKPGCVIMKGRRFDAVEPFVWHPSETLPEGEVVALWLEEGERGNGGMVVAMVFFGADDDPDRWTYWTHGGPNGGSDVDMPHGEKPTKWMKILPPKPEEVIDHERTVGILETA